MVRVALRHLRVLVPHQPLDRVGIDAVLAEPRRERMPQVVEATVLDAGPGPRFAKARFTVPNVRWPSLAIREDHEARAPCPALPPAEHGHRAVT